jgi:hypothetical protein
MLDAVRRSPANSNVVARLVNTVVEAAVRVLRLFYHAVPASDYGPRTIKVYPNQTASMRGFYTATTTGQPTPSSPDQFGEVITSPLLVTLAALPHSTLPDKVLWPASGATLKVAGWRLEEDCFWNFIPLRQERPLPGEAKLQPGELFPGGSPGNPVAPYTRFHVEEWKGPGVPPVSSFLAFERQVDGASEQVHSDLRLVYMGVTPEEAIAVAEGGPIPCG